MHESIEKAVQSAVFKKNILDSSILQYIIRASLAGVFIGLAIVLCFKIGDSFNIVHSPATTLMSGIFFGIALILIIYGGGELFTGNTMFFTISTLKKETQIRDLIRNWVFCFGGNAIGAILFALVFSRTGIFDQLAPNHLLFEVVNRKMHLPIDQLFFRAIFCNWLVCLAIWIPMQLKSDAAKLMAIILLVFTFFASGYEHSIANLSLFSLALSIAHPASITLQGALYNIIPVTLGNILGGGLFVGAVYYYLSKGEMLAAKKQAEPSASNVVEKETQPELTPELLLPE
ncbi:formate/nitrite transporter family protein [Terrilactibacillus laevilacticus]|uniref:Formate/nitrite transporter family protein n=1 Tax=Terrilactibacillus laevilacticus TaxID=1380157 RepID=A0ABW5PSV3_9BACI|nr:formate/nitrite transporter family protein [Terrilactibacillus laevilacticus]